VSRLDDIVARNKHPRRYRKMRFPVGIMLSGFVLLVLVLIIFTDMGLSKPYVQQPASTEDGGKRVDGVLLYRGPPNANMRDAGVRD
jgi:hypothetical protein